MEQILIQRNQVQIPSDYTDLTLAFEQYKLHQNIINFSCPLSGKIIIHLPKWVSQLETFILSS